MAWRGQMQRVAIGVQRFVVAIGNPLRAPVLRVQQSHGPARRRAPAGSAVRFIPDLHLPEALHAGGEHTAGIHDLVGGIAGHATAVPTVGFAAREFLRARSDPNLPSGLRRSALGRFEAPGQAGRRTFNIVGSDEIFDPQCG